jgi:hypothetical protein
VLDFSVLELCGTSDSLSKLPPPRWLRGVEIVSPSRRLRRWPGVLVRGVVLALSER